MIKSLVLFACVLVATNALSETLKGQFMEKMMEIGKTCVKEVGANEDDIAELLAHKLPSRHEGECMVYCFHKHLGLVYIFPGSSTSLRAVHTEDDMRKRAGTLKNETKGTTETARIVIHWADNPSYCSFME